MANAAIDLRDAPLPDASIVRVVDAGTVLSNLGCQATGERVWCQVANLRGKRRGFVERKHLRPAVGPDGAVAVGTDDSRQRARKGDFDVMGTIPCAQERGQALGVCEVGVARSGGGDATVVATFSNGFSRSLYFVHGRFVSANATMSGSGTDTDWQRDADVHHIRVDDQRYELHDDLIVGD